MRCQRVRQAEAGDTATLQLLGCAAAHQRLLMHAVGPGDQGAGVAVVGGCVPSLHVCGPAGLMACVQSWVDGMVVAVSACVPGVQRRWRGDVSVLVPG
jgi:hypothetical protein